MFEVWGGAGLSTNTAATDSVGQERISHRNIMKGLHAWCLLAAVKTALLHEVTDGALARLLEHHIMLLYMILLYTFISYCEQCCMRNTCCCSA